MIWFVSTSGNDSTGDGLTPATAYLTPAKAVSVASAGDVILLGVGTFALAAALKWTISLKMLGAGIGATIISGSAVNYICPGGSSELRGFSSSAQLRYVIDNGDTPWTRLRCEKTRWTSTFDAYFPDGDGDGALTEFHDCEFQSAECIITTSASNLTTRLYDCVLTGTQTAIHGSGSTITEAFRCRLAPGAAADATFKYAVAGTNGVVRLFDSAIIPTGGTAAATTQIANSGGTVEVCRTSYDVSKTTGTITRLPSDAPTAAENAAGVWASATRVLTAADNITSTGGTIPITAGKVDANASVSLSPSDITDISDAIIAALNATGVALTTVERAAVAAAVAAAILVTPANKLATDSSNRVTTSNPATIITVNQSGPTNVIQS